MESPGLTRRRLIQGAGAGALALSPAANAALAAARPRDHRHRRRIRRPDSLPYPHRPEGEATNAFPFDHIVVVMENHSFDCYFGMLPRRGQRGADGFTFNRRGLPKNRNPLEGGFAGTAYGLISTPAPAPPARTARLTRFGNAFSTQNAEMRLTGPDALMYGCLRGPGESAARESQARSGSQR